jgi:hypothetical protein
MLKSPAHVDLDVGGEGTAHQQTSLPGPPSSQTSPPLPSHPPSAMVEDSQPPAQAPEVEGGRPRRQCRLPARYRDNLPEPAPISITPTDEMRQPSEAPAPLLPRIRLIVRDSICTMANTFGLWREYLHRPSFDPDSFVPSDDLAPAGEAQTDHGIQETSSAGCEPSPRSPSRNPTVNLLLDWQNTGSELKSNGEVNKLVDVLRNPDFSVEELVGFDAARENRQQDQQDKKSPEFKGFQETTVKIDVPSGEKNVPSTTLEVPGLHHRKLTTVIRSAFESPLASKFHYSPFKLFHQPASSKLPERVYSELYNSDAFIKEHDRVQRAPVPEQESDCKLEKVVAALMFWSDATHLANFGTAKLWPIYMFLGNLSKYTRAEPTSNACYHIAYIPSLADSFQDALASIHAKWNTQKKQILAHCRRELVHGIWRIVLDDDFLHAYKYGIVIKCHDGVVRRVYPRIFTYSADYPEK